MNELQAAVGLVVLDFIDEEREKRKRLIEVYQSCFSEIAGISFFTPPPHVKSNYQYMVIRINEEEFGWSRNEVYDELKKYNVFSRKYFFPLCSDYACYKSLPSSAAANLPVARQVVQETLSLPLYGELGENSAETIATLVKMFGKVRKSRPGN